MEPTEVIARICTFLDFIGIPYSEGKSEVATFLPGLEIRNGAVKIDRSRLTYPGDLLHEAGHIALTTPELRTGINQEMLEVKDQSNSEEMGVLLWTYLAAQEIGLPLEAIFHAGGYKGQSNWLVQQFESGNYIGLPLLVWMGIVAPGVAGTKPNVTSWLRVSGE